MCVFLFVMFKLTLILIIGGEVYTWGHGSSGQLGLGDKSAQEIAQRIPPAKFQSQKVVSIAAGRRKKKRYRGIVERGDFKEE